MKLNQIDVERSKITEVERLASQLEAIGNWQMDQVCTETKTGKLMVESARWLRKLATRMCGAGIIGCGGGHGCDSDHK